MTAKTTTARDEQLAAAREEAKLLKAQREAREAQAAAHAQAVQPELLHAAIPEYDFGIELPSWKRVVCGLVLAFAGAFTVGYGIGCLMSYALAGIATMVGAGALAFCLSVLVWILGIYSAWKLGGWVGGKIFASVVLPDGLASRSIASLTEAASGAKGWLTQRPAVQRVTAMRDAFSNGAYVREAGQPA